MIVCLHLPRYRVTIGKASGQDASTERVMLMDHAGQRQDGAAAPVHPAALDPEVLARQCEFRATRRSRTGWSKSQQGRDRGDLDPQTDGDRPPRRPSGEPRAKTGAWPSSGSDSSWP